MRPHTPTDDVQLWVTVKDVGRVWPLYATPSNADGDCYFVELAVPAETADHWRFVSHWLNSVAFDGDGTHWLIRPTNFEQVCRKCLGITPSFYWKWPSLPDSKSAEPSENAPVEKSDPTEPEQSRTDEFIRYCCAENGWPNFHTVSANFTLICRSAVRWLLVNRKPLDLRFCTLYALPVRKDALAILKQQWPHIGTTLRRKKNRSGILEGLGVIKSLHNPDLVEMPTNETFGWSLFVAESKPFDQIVNQLERETLRNSTPARYVLRLGSVVKKSYGQIIELLAAYYAKTNLSMGHVDTSLPRHLYQLHPKIPHYRRGKIKPQGVQDVPASAPVAPATQSECQSAVDAPKNENLQPLRDAEPLPGA